MTAHPVRRPAVRPRERGVRRAVAVALLAGAVAAPALGQPPPPSTAASPPSAAASPPSAAASPAPSSSAAPAAATAGTLIARAVVRFHAPELGGPEAPRFIFERELAFEARLEALADSTHDPARQGPFRERHVRAALERHIAEELLASRAIPGVDVERAVAAQLRLTEARVTQAVGGADRLEAARRAERLEPFDVQRVLHRRARSAVYLLQVVEPALRPSDAELRRIHRTTPNPWAALPFAEHRDELARWVTTERLTEAVEQFFQESRPRVSVTLLVPSASDEPGPPAR